MKETRLLAVVAVAGLLAGAGAFYLTQQEGYCDRVEDGIRQNASFNGSIACYPPGEAEVNVTDAIENRTSLRCVCRKSYMGEVSVFTINVAD